VAHWLGSIAASSDELAEETRRRSGKKSRWKKRSCNFAKI
jgi:hypothetical protein